MKDTAVDPAGLFDLKRQRRLLDGMVNRFRGSLSKQQMLQSAHAQQRSVEEAQFSSERAKIANDCRIVRRRMLEQWDQAEEQAIRQYETSTVTVRQDLQRLDNLFRRKAEEEKQAVERKVLARHQAVQHQYENRKNQPGQQQRREISTIDDALEPVQTLVQSARDLTLRRLDHVPDVGPAEEPDQDIEISTPTTIDESVESIRMLSQKCQQIVNEMQTTTASRIVDSYALPLAVVALAICWAIVAYFVSSGSPLWMVAGIVPAAAIGFATYLALMLPLKRTTQRLFPTVERIGRAAEACAEAGKKISTDIADEASNELKQRRDDHLQSTQRWMDEQLNLLQQRLESEQQFEREKLSESLHTVDRDYIESFTAVDHQMRSKADTVAQQISHQLATIDNSLQQRRDANAARRFGQLQYLNNRLTQGVRLGIERMNQVVQATEDRYPDWSRVLSAQRESPGIDYLPLGWLRIDETLRSALRAEQPESAAGGNGSIDSSAVPQLITESQLPGRLPVVLHRRLYSAVVIRCAAADLNKAIELTHQILWRLLSAAPPARAKLTLIDPLGRGQNFTSFMALADHDPAIVGHRIWTTDSKIEARLAELAQHVEDVLQASLRDRFERIEDYNQVAGSMSEPYRAIAAVGFPEALSRGAYSHLRALVESGLRCGIFTILVCDKSKAWPSDMPVPSGEKVLELEINEQGDWHLLAAGLQQIPFAPACPPPQAIRNELIKHIGTAAVSASKVKVPLHNVLSAADEGKGSSDNGLSIVIGSQGANRSLALELGEGVRQHVLIAGKTGSGKSTLLHSIISSAAHHYRPDQLQFYLLDFKKGVEFKPYAEIGLPHARVIGIESEREFGQSVLQRLDTELQQRGEKFRAAGAQSLAEYRRKSGQPMPRIMLVIDEFQELFVRDDRLAGDCAMLLDRLVRQGRSFGMHVILSSQSLAGAYSLPRATLGQMAVRIAMQCSESDASLILSDDNTAARLISRPGEAIYNDAGGLIEGNQPFQVAWLSADRHREMLSAITARDQAYQGQLDPAVVFEGNRPCRWSAKLAENALGGATTTSDGAAGLRGLLGESVVIGPPLAIEFTRDTGHNVLLIATLNARQAIVGSVVTAIAKQDPRLQVLYFDGSRATTMNRSPPGWKLPVFASAASKLEIANRRWRMSLN